MTIFWIHWVKYITKLNFVCVFFPTVAAGNFDITDMVYIMTLDNIHLDSDMCARKREQEYMS